MLAIYLKLRQMEKRVGRQDCYFSAFVDSEDLAASYCELPNVMEPGQRQDGFFPRGAIFFFALLLLFYGALWLTIYWIMIARS